MNVTELNENLENDTRIIVKKSTDRLNYSTISDYLDDFIHTEYKKSLSEQDCLDRFRRTILLCCNTLRTVKYGEIIARTLKNMIRIYVNYDKFELIDVEYSPLNFWFYKSHISRVEDGVQHIVLIDNVEYVCYRTCVDKKVTPDKCSIFDIGSFIIDFKLNNEIKHCVFTFKITRNSGHRTVMPDIKNITEDTYQKFIESRDKLVSENPYLRNSQYSDYDDSLLTILAV